MSSADPVATLTVPSDSRSSDRLFLQLARALASSGPNSGIAIERKVGSAIAQIVVRPPALIEGVEPGLRHLATGGARSGRSPAAPPVGWNERFGVLTVVATHDRTLERPTGGKEPVRGLPNPMTLQGAWIDTRTYWVPRSQGGLWAARLYHLAFPSSGTPAAWVDAAGTTLAQHWSTMLGRPCFPQTLSGWTAGRAWRSWSSDAAPREAWIALDVERASAAADLPRPAFSVSTVHREVGHLSVFGTSGAGETSFLAELGSEAIRRGQSVVALDLHGDLTMGIVARLGPAERERVIAVDITDRPIPGINVLGGRAMGDGDRSVAHLVAALKRLSPDGEGIYWGFRLERIFDSFIRLVQEEGGSLVDLAGALQSPERREALRAGTRRPELARFLDELGPVLQRQPDFLWPAAARLSKVVLVPALRELLAPEGAGLAWEEGLRNGRSLLVRLPFAEIGSETAALASTLLLTRIYLAHAASIAPEESGRPLLLLLDEGHAFSPRLIAEILSEGRKFGVRAVVSTQYPERLSPEVEHAVRGAASTHVCFRVPPSSVRKTAEWLGVDRSMPAEQLASLPTGTGIVVGRRIETVTIPAPPSGSGAGTWRMTVARTRTENGLGEEPFGVVEATQEPDEAAEALLLAVLVAHEAGTSATDATIVQAAAASIAGGGDPATLVARWSHLVKLRWVLPAPTGWVLGSAGAEALGIGRKTGASRESAEHRALLLEAFRVFARRGYRLEILRQGRFDTTLPDARLELIHAPRARSPPEEVARQVDRARTGWAWRFFHGHSVNVEAEVSGALRPERVRHGCRKAVREGAFILFLVADAVRARRVRNVLRDLGLGPDRAQVWTLAGALRARTAQAETR